jgi:hypothetical protein
MQHGRLLPLTLRKMLPPSSITGGNGAAKPLVKDWSWRLSGWAIEPPT